MTNITLELLQPQITQRLKARASKNGRSIEAEITAILCSVLISEQPQTESLGLATAIQRHFADIEDFEIPEIPRKANVDPQPIVGEVSPVVNRSAFLKLPIADRRRILEQQAEAALPHYQQDTEWQEWLNLDISEIHA